MIIFEWRPVIRKVLVLIMVLSLIPPFEKKEYIFDNKEITQSFAFGLRKGTYTGKIAAICYLDFVMSV